MEYDELRLKILIALPKKFKEIRKRQKEISKTQESYIQNLPEMTDLLKQEGEIYNFVKEFVIQYAFERIEKICESKKDIDAIKEIIIRLI